MNSVLQILEEEYYFTDGMIVHAGANLCQEAAEYSVSSFSPVLWIEALPELVERSRKLLFNYQNQFLVEAALWNTENAEIEFHVASNDGASSSILSMAQHRILHPQIYETKSLKMKTTTLDKVISNFSGNNLYDISLLVLDLQGAEYMVLQGATNTLNNTRAILIEVSTFEMYKGQVLFREIYDFLNRYGFRLVKSDIDLSCVCGDVLFVLEKHITSQRVMPFPFVPKYLPTPITNRIKFLLIKLGIKPRIFTITTKWNKFL